MNLRFNLSRRFLASSIRPLSHAVVLAVALTVATAGPARAGTVGDTIRAVADWVSGVEAVVGGWFSKTLAEIKVPNRAEAAAVAVRRAALEDPAQLASMAKQVGFRLTNYRVDQLEQQIAILEFAYDRAVDNETRLSLWREILQVENSPVRPELELVRALLDASDWRHVEVGAEFVMVGVEIEAGRQLSTRLIYQAQTPTQ